VLKSSSQTDGHLLLLVLVVLFTSGQASLELVWHSLVAALTHGLQIHLHKLIPEQQHRSGKSAMLTQCECSWQWFDILLFHKNFTIKVTMKSKQTVLISYGIFLLKMIDNCFKFMFLVILNQNKFLLQLLFSDDEGGAITCHSHEIHQWQTTTIKASPVYI